MQTTTLEGAAQRAGRRRWLGLAALALPALLVALDIGALFLALPHLSAELGATGTQQLWITDIYGFLLAGFLITMGNLGDRIGRRRLLLIGAAAFGVASVLAAYSTSPQMLIGARALLGVAGATLGPVSVALSLVAILPAIYGIKELAVHGAQAVPVAALLAGLAVGVVFLGRQLRLDSPLLDLRLFSRPTFSAALIAMTLGSAALAGAGLMTSQYLQSVIGLQPAEAGLWQAPTGLGIAAGVLLAPVVAQRVKPIAAIGAGMVISTLGFLSLTQVGSSGGLVAVAFGIAVAAFGVGPMFVLGTSLVVGSAPPAKAGSAASLSETSNVFGSTLGLAVLGSVGAAVYHHQMAGSVTASLAPEAAHVAGETIAGAVAVAGQLPTGPAAELLQAARDAFTSGLNVAAAVGVIITAAVALGLTAAFRRARLGGT